MANNFLNDPNCVALWRFENGALTTDSIGSNTLTDYNTVGTNTVDFKEGSACADFEKNSSEYLAITNANLDAGFPLKSGDTNKKISLCFWFKPESVLIGVLFAIYTTTPAARVFQFTENVVTGGLGMVSGYNNGANFEEKVFTGADINAGNWYHFGVTFDGIAKTGTLRLWDGSTASDYSVSFTNEIDTTPAPPLSICARGDALFYNDGLVDEMVVFKDILTTTEIDQIRNGTYGATHTITNDIDLVLKRLNTNQTVNINSILQKIGISKTVDIDLILKKLGITKLSNIDLVLKKLNLIQQSTINLALKKLGITNSTDIDLILSLFEVTKTASIDLALKKLNLTQQSSIDFILKQIDLALTVDIDSILKQLNLALTIDFVTFNN